MWVSFFLQYNFRSRRLLGKWDILNFIYHTSGQQQGRVKKSALSIPRTLLHFTVFLFFRTIAKSFRELRDTDIFLIYSCLFGT